MESTLITQCIRGFLDVSKKCPSCGEIASEGQIRRNRALEEITDAWDAARYISTGLLLLSNRPLIYTWSQSGPSRRRSSIEPISNVSSRSNVLAKRSRMSSTSRSQSPAVRSEKADLVTRGSVNHTFQDDAETSIQEQLRDEGMYPHRARAQA